jgi:hypothetical protein
MVNLTTPSCSYCTRFHRDNLESETCDAFPDGIPTEIGIDGTNLHLTPVDGDKGLVFEPLPGFEWVLEGEVKP